MAGLGRGESHGRERRYKSLGLVKKLTGAYTKS